MQSLEASSVMNYNTFRNTRSSQRNQRIPIVSAAKSARNKTPKNHGERLYKNGLKRMEEREKRNLHEKLRREMDEVENLTFQPNINEISRFIGKDDGQRLEDRLIENGRKKQYELERKRDEVLHQRYN